METSNIVRLHIWDPAPSSMNAKKTGENVAVCIVNVPKSAWSAKYHSLLDNFQLSSLSSRSAQSKHILTYKFINKLNYLPSDILFPVGVSSRPSCSYDPLNLVPPLSNTSANLNSFPSTTPKLGNPLPSNMKEAIV